MNKLVANYDLLLNLSLIFTSQYNNKMRSKKVNSKQRQSVSRLKTNEDSLDSTFDKSKNIRSRERQNTIKQSKSKEIYPKSVKTVRLSTKAKQKELSQQPQFDKQIKDIMKMSDQISSTKAANDKIELHLQQQNYQENGILFAKLHKLFNLYIKEEMLKHYCLKSGWKIEKKFLDNLVIPTFDLLAISRQKLPHMFEPFLKEITSKYILQTQLDTFSRLSPEFLLIQITQIWLKIKQAEIEVKRQIRVNFGKFRSDFCERISGKLVIERNNLYNAIFANSKDIRMVNLIKLYIFCYKATGENNEQSFQQWLEQY